MLVTDTRGHACFGHSRHAVDSGSGSPAHSLTMSFDAQTPRRSKRYQPLVASASTSKINRELPVTFLGDAIFTRDAKTDDLHDEDCVDLEEEENAQTNFYGGFRKSRTRQSTSKKPHNDGGENEEFRVGDTVLVQTHSRLPSIGVVVAIWEVIVVGEEGSEEQKYQKVKVHWFLRPNELATVRAKRDHEEVCSRCSTPSTGTDLFS